MGKQSRRQRPLKSLQRNLRSNRRGGSRFAAFSNWLGRSVSSLRSRLPRFIRGHSPIKHTDPDTEIIEFGPSVEEVTDPSQQAEMLTLLKQIISSQSQIDLTIEFRHNQSIFPTVEFQLGNNKLKSLPDPNQLKLSQAFQSKKKLFYKTDRSFDTTFTDCTCVEFKTDYINLESYYFYFREIMPFAELQNEGICQPMEHSLFFNIMDFFSSILKQEIYLDKDLSIKWIKTCPIPVSVMFLVQVDKSSKQFPRRENDRSIKGSTFFERMGFTNEGKHRLLLSFKNKTIDALNHTNKTDIKQLQTNIEKLKNRIVDYELYVYNLTDKRVTISDIATWFYLLCAHNHKITENPLFISTLKLFGECISKEVFDIQSETAENQHNLQPDPFVRPISKKKYKFTITALPEGKYKLTIVLQDYTSRKGGKNTRRIK